MKPMRKILINADFEQLLIKYLIIQMFIDNFPKKLLYLVRDKPN